MALRICVTSLMRLRITADRGASKDAGARRPLPGTLDPTPPGPLLLFAGRPVHATIAGRAPVLWACSGDARSLEDQRMAERDLLADLTPAQQEAVTHRDGPLLILAGAG